MKLLTLALISAAILGGVVGTLLVRDPGYIMVVYGDTVFETSFWVGVVLLLLIYGLMSAALVLGIKILRGQSRLSDWRSGRQAEQARDQTLRGLSLMIEARWLEAQRALRGGAEKSAMPQINHLNAARAAHALGEIQARDDDLQQALVAWPKASFAINLLRTEFLIQDASFEQALVELLALRKLAPKHVDVLLKIAHCYEALGNWQALSALLDELAKAKALSETALEDLRHKVWTALLIEAQDIADIWKKLPKRLRAESSVARAWIDHLLATEREDAAQKAIPLVLAQQWDSDLAEKYGVLSTSDAARQLTTAKEWLKAHPADAQVALTVGRLSLKNRQFDQAREYFELSLRLRQGRAIYAELGRLCISMGEVQRGSEYLLRSLTDLQDLPLPDASAGRRLVKP